LLKAIHNPALVTQLLGGASNTTSPTTVAPVRKFVCRIERQAILEPERKRAARAWPIVSARVWA